MYNASNILVKARNTGFKTKKSVDWYRNVYLQSEHWRSLREEKLARSCCCEKCGTFHNLDVHHRNYRCLYDVKMSDLITLCRSCHNREHEKKKKKSRKTFNGNKWKNLTAQIAKQLLEKKYKKPIHLSIKNIQRRKRFDKETSWKYRHINTYVSIHY